MNIEKKTARTTDSPTIQRRNKDSVTQMQVVFKCFFESPKTMYQVEKETGVCRPNVCRYVCEWEKKGNIQELRKGKCPVSGYTAGFYSTNKELFKKEERQRSFWDMWKGGFNE